MTQRTVYIAHTNTGLEGYGEYSGPPVDQEVLDHYINTSPFEHINDEVHLGLGTAMYDLMGKATGLPCHRLFGAQCRTYVPVSSWFNATSPARMAEAVKYYAEMGHTWMKFHLSPFENVIEQTKAMQAVAPVGFQIHYDFTMYGDQGGQGGRTHVAQLLEALSEFPIAGCYEDVLWQHDMVGYEELRRRANRPIGLHHFPLGVTTEMMQHRMGDFYMLGHGLIGTNAKKAGVFEAAKAPFMMQNTGGAITRAMNAHMSSVFTTATFHSVSATEVWPEDVCEPCAYHEVINGTIRVTDTPGLGVSVNRETLERLKARRRNPRHDALYLIKSTYENGVVMYNAQQHDVTSSTWMVYGPYDTPIGFAEAKTTEYLDDDGSPEWAAIAKELRTLGVNSKKHAIIMRKTKL